MRVRFKLTERDALNMQRFSTRPLWALLAFAFLMIVMFAGGIFLIERDLGEVGWVVLAASVVLCIVVYGIPRFELRKAMRTSAVLKGEIEYGFSSACVEVIQATGETKLWWSAYKKYKETEHFFVVFISSANIFVPKRVMTPEQIQEIRGLLDEKMNAKNIAATN